jgi:FlaA1/EpsC-like NDP-sugar epimerase
MKIRDLFDKYRRPLIVFAHLIIISISYIVSFLLRFDFRISDYYVLLILRTISILVLAKLIVFYYYGLFSGLWRYASIDDVWRIFKANFFSSAIFILAIIFIHNTYGYPRSIFFIDFILCTMFTSGLRFVTRLFREKFRPMTQKYKKKVLIVGAGEAGVMVLRECRNNPSFDVQIVGFIDDSPSKTNLHVQGVKILGTRQDITSVVNQYEVDEIIIAIPSAKGEVIRDIISHCQIPNIKLKIIPGLHKILNGDLEVKPRYVKPEDLLGREVVQIKETEIKSYLKGKSILVTGAAGSIGSELCRQIIGFTPFQMILFDRNENDLYFLEVEFRTKYPQMKIKTIVGDAGDISLLKHVFSIHKPEVIFHSAAYKHVPLMEDNPVAAVQNNVIVSRNLIYASHHYRVERFVLISTDKAVNPTSVMGVTKRLAEMILQAKAISSKTKFMAVRFGNVIGSSGSAVPLFKKQIEEGGPVTVTDPESKRYFMSVSEAAQLVLQAAAIGKGGEIFILDMGEQIKIIDLARNLIILSGLNPERDMEIKFVGLRPGEKLYEETLIDSEKDKATKYDKIYIAQPNDFDIRKIRRQIKELEHLAEKMDGLQIIAKLKEIVPSYYPYKGK